MIGTALMTIWETYFGFRNMPANIAP
jgi:hypothetical protein